MSGYVYESDEIKYLLSLFDKIDGFKYLTDNYMELSEAIECVKSFDESVINKKCFIVTFQEIFNTGYTYFVEKELGVVLTSTKNGKYYITQCNPELTRNIYDYLTDIVFI